jgi:hypothetical protein
MGGGALDPRTWINETLMPGPSEILAYYIRLISTDNPVEVTAAHFGVKPERVRYIVNWKIRRDGELDPIEQP